MTDRQIRRAAERQARKEEIQASRAQRTANQANAQLSTGPRTEAGKAASSQNRRSYGLTGEFVVLPNEDENEYMAMFEALIKEHKPATPTEQILLKKMAQHHWMADRALYQQANCFYEEDFFIMEKQLSLFMRYHTMHNRAFHKALTDLRKEQKERQQQELGIPQLKAATLTASLFLKQAKSKCLQQNGFESKNPPEPHLPTQTTPNQTAPNQTAPYKTEPGNVSDQRSLTKEIPAAA